jgi:hypothetical protein
MTTTPTMTTTSSNGNPSRRVDELARRVLVAARWPNVRTTIPPPSSTNGGVFGSGSSSPTPHLDELERSVGVAPRLPPPSPSCGDDDDDGGDGGGGSGGPMACTPPPSGGGGGDDDERGGSWTWTPCGTPGDPGDEQRDECENDEDDCGPSSLIIDLAPLPPDFYVSLGALFSESCRPGSDAPRPLAAAPPGGGGAACRPWGGAAGGGAGARAGAASGGGGRRMP